MSYNGITIKHVVATDINSCIGKAGQMPWHCPADLKRFKELTKGGVVIMGRKTFGSLNYKPLPDRLNLVISRQRIHSYPVMVLNDTEDALSYGSSKAKELGLDTVWIIGGADIYRQTMQYVDVIEHTMIDTEAVDGDAFYPDVRDEFDAIDVIETSEADYYTLHRRL